MTRPEPTESPVTAPLLRAGDVAKLLGVPRSSVYEYVRSGQLPHIKIGRHVRFCQHQLADWIARRGRADALRP